MDINSLLNLAVQEGASDLHLTVGIPPVIRHHGELKPLENQGILSAENTKSLAFGILSEDQKQHFQKTRELDFSYSIAKLGRFRVNMFWQRGEVAAVIRAIPSDIPKPADIGLSDHIVDLTKQRNGLVLVTGPTGSGKSTTLAAMINYINQHMNKNIITVEDPIEFTYKHNLSIINQREVGSDTLTFASALKAALREDPDVILVGEMRDLETISATLTIAETGHLAFATLHTVNVAQTIDRIIDVFPASHQSQVRMMLSVVLRAIVCQQLLPNITRSGLVAAREVLISNHALSNIIREGGTHQIQTCIQTGRSAGMCTMEDSIKDLYQRKQISKEVTEAALGVAVQEQAATEEI